MATVPNDDHADTSLAATPETLLQWADVGQAMLEGLSRATNAPDDHRALRTFRKAEAMEIGGISEWRWAKWRKTVDPSLGNAGEARLTLADIHRIQEECGLRPRRPEGSRPMRVAVSNFKGGASKTMTALHVSHYFAFHGWRTLVIDTDPQGTLSRLFGLRPEVVDKDLTLSDVFSRAAEKGAPRGVATQLHPTRTHIDGLDLIPASLDMIGADISVAAAFMNKTEASKDFYRLVDMALTTVEDDYDIVILDTAPAFSFAALNVLWAANSLLVPAPPSIPDFSATVDFAAMAGDILDNVCKLTGEQKVWNPAVLVHSRVENESMSETVRQMSGKTFGVHRLEEFVPKSSAFANAVGRLRSVYEVTAADVDSRSLRRARDACDALGSRMIQLFQQAWKEQVEANS